MVAATCILHLGAMPPQRDHQCRLAARRNAGAVTLPSDGLHQVRNDWRRRSLLSQRPRALAPARGAIHPEDLPRVEAAWRAHLTRGEPFELEHRMRRADGEYRWHFVRRVPHRTRIRRARSAEGSAVWWLVDGKSRYRKRLALRVTVNAGGS